MSGSRGDADVIVVGAGPSGAAAVAALAQRRRGTRILWLEAKRFPRGKACGDAWGPRAVRVIRQMGALERFVAGLRHAPTAVEFVTPDRKRWVIPLPTPMLVVTRRHGDTVLRDRALELAGPGNVELVEECRVVSPLLDAGRVAGVVAKPKGGPPVEYRAGLVVDASGASSRIAPRCNPAKTAPAHTHGACRAYFTGVEGLGDRIELYVAKDLPGYFWVFPLGRGDGTANVGHGVHREWLEERGLPLEAAADRLLEGHPELARRLAGATQLAPYRRWILGFREPEMACEAPGLLLAGDAANLVQVATGAGLPYALMSGRMAGHAAARVLTPGADDAAERRAYHRRLRHLLFREVTHVPGTPLSRFYQLPRPFSVELTLRAARGLARTLDLAARTLRAGSYAIPRIANAAAAAGHREIRGGEDEPSAGGPGAGGAARRGG